MKFRPDMQLSAVSEKDPVPTDEMLEQDMDLSNMLGLLPTPPCPKRLDAKILQSFLALKKEHANIAHQRWVIKSFAIGFLLFLMFGFVIIIGMLVGFMTLDRSILLSILTSMVGLVSLVFTGVVLIITGKILPVFGAKVKSELLQQLVEADEVQDVKKGAPVAIIQPKRRAKGKIIKRPVYSMSGG
jgi:hypothetical protein